MAPPLASTQGERFGPYILGPQIGEGGAGLVYRARHVDPRYAEHAFAIKRLHRHLTSDAQTVAGRVLCL